MYVLYLKKQQLDIKERTLFSLEAIGLQEGEKIGLIGPNGSGKTSLLKKIMAAAKQHNPLITIHQDLGYLPQSMPSNEQSGGEQIKTQLLQLLHGSAGCLLLDEPSTNLDATQQRWVAETLKNTEKSLLLISHDRRLLAEVVTSIWWLEEQHLHVFKGGFPEFEAFQKRRKEKQLAAYAAQQQQERQLQAEIKRRKEKAARMQRRKRTVSISDWKDQAGTTSYDKRQKGMAKSAKSIEKRLERTPKLKKPTTQAAIKLQIIGQLNPAPGSFFQLPAQALPLPNGNNLTLAPFTMRSGQHIGLSGKNGSGKTCFLQALYHCLQPKRSTLNARLFRPLSVGYFEQSLTAFKPDLSLEVFVQQNSLQPSQKIYDLLGGLGFDYADIKKPYTVLSGGEKIRANLARVLAGDHTLLLLDEPTNYLDNSAQAVLRSFLKDYPGAFLLVSHDQELLDATCSQQFVIEKNQLKDAAVYSAQSPSTQTDQLATLLYQKDQIIQDPSQPFSELQAILKQIAQLKKNSSPDS